MFNWEILNKGKYSKADSKPSPIEIKKASKGMKLEALQYNPAATLSPVNEEDLKMKDEIGARSKEIRKPKVLNKIDEAQLSSAAKAGQLQNVEYPLVNVVGPKGQQGKYKGGPLPKVPFAKHEINS